MSYTFDTARKEATGFSQSIILKAIECGRIDGTNNLLGNWKIEYREPHQTYLPRAQSAEKDGVQASAAPDAPLLEAEIAALVIEAEGSLRQHGAGHRDTADAFHAPADSHALSADPDNAGERTATQPINFESKVNEPRPERRAWDPDIRINDPERATKAVWSSSAQSTYAVIGVLLGACVMGWIVGVPPSLIDGHLSNPVEQKVGSSGPAPGSRNQTTFTGPETGRAATPGISNTGKVAAAAPGAHGHRPGYTKSAALRPDAIRTSSVTQQSSGPSEPATSDLGRRTKILPSLMPFPETRPETIEGWTVRDVYGATAVLEGPDGIWRAARGDTVPRVGRVESIVRWGSRWIVVTSSGLISTP
jgi:hypothetical protein